MGELSLYTHVSESIGRPDLIELSDGLVCLRFEVMKVLSALTAVEHLLQTGVIEPGDTLVDSSSGIYAYALALAAHRYRMRCHIVGSTTVDATLRAQLAVLGTTLEQMPPCADLKLDQCRRVARIKEILAANPHYHWMQQYHDDVHYLGYRAIAQMIRRELGETDLTIVGGVGTGASTGGLATTLRESHPDTTLIGVQPFGSISFGADHLDDPDIIIAGIGSSIPFDNVTHDLYDTVHWIAFRAAHAGTIELLRRHAIFAGLSAGAAFLAALWEQQRAPQRTTVFITADTGHRYLDSVFAVHDQAPPIESFTPLAVTDQEDLELPWSYRDYHRDAGNHHQHHGTEGDPTVRPRAPKALRPAAATRR